MRRKSTPASVRETRAAAMEAGAQIVHQLRYCDTAFVSQVNQCLSAGDVLLLYLLHKSQQFCMLLRRQCSFATLLPQLIQSALGFRWQPAANNGTQQRSFFLIYQQRDPAPRLEPNYSARKLGQFIG
ncbi:MAG TPA: hypothetical protein DEP84_28145 [Chloroflexi bacterium]|nr:hypothetical protein [Chloroflexota bacterium]